MNWIVVVIIALVIIWFLIPLESFGSTSPGTLLQLATSRPYYNPGELYGYYPNGLYDPYYAVDPYYTVY